MSYRTRVLLADDHPVVAQGLASLLHDEFQIVGVADDGHSLVRMALETNPDVIIADISMPHLSGLDALRQLHAERSDIRFVFLTMHAVPALAAAALREGAAGFLLKQSAGEELIAAIHQVMAGRVYITPRIAGDLIAALTQPEAAMADRITPRQRDVLRLVAAGQTMKQVAAALHLSRRTVESHKYEMMQTLGIATTAELIRFALDNGIVSPSTVLAD
jgi:DNA-binding NarL/FixJ family response regulator